MFGYFDALWRMVTVGITVQEYYYVFTSTFIGLAVGSLLLYALQWRDETRGTEKR